MTLEVDIKRAHGRYRAMTPASAQAHSRAMVSLPGGNTRTVLHFDPYPFRVASAEGHELVDIDGSRYIDFCGNYSAGLLGHSPPSVEKAVIAGLDPLFAANDLACVLVETVQGSGGCRPASREFIAELRRRCDNSGTVLIFDEVMTSRLRSAGFNFTRQRWRLIDPRPSIVLRSGGDEAKPRPSPGLER